MKSDMCVNYIGLVYFALMFEFVVGILSEKYCILTLWFFFQCQREGYVQRVKDEEGEGCNLQGSLEVNKVAGNFHFATGKSFLQSAIFLADVLALQDNHYNVRQNWFFIIHCLNCVSYSENFDKFSMLPFCL